jgi:hypothetical protein
MLAPHLPPDLLTEALAAATATGDDTARALALAMLAPHLPPDLLTEALAAATATGDDFVRARALEVTPKTSGEALAALLHRSRSVLPRRQEAAYINLLRESINGTDRKVCFYLLTVGAPAIAEFGGAHAVEQCFHAVVDVSRWWP